jgi:hypothetical protein
MLSQNKIMLLMMMMLIIFRKTGTLIRFHNLIPTLWISVKFFRIKTMEVPRLKNKIPIINKFLITKHQLKIISMIKMIMEMIVRIRRRARMIR